MTRRTFKDEVQDILNPENHCEMAEENREAIKLIAKEVRRLKENSETQADQQDRENMLDALGSFSDTTKSHEHVAEHIDSEQEQQDKEETEEQEEVKEVSLGNSSSLKARILKYQHEHRDTWNSSRDIADVIGFNKDYVKNKVTELKKQGLLETKSGHGSRLAENVEIVDHQDIDLEKQKERKKEEVVTCLICGNEFTDRRGFSSHLSRTHNLNNADLEQDDEWDTLTVKYQEEGKTSNQINNLKEELGEVETPVDKDPLNEIDRNKGEKIDSNFYSIEERETLMAHILKESDKPLTRTELAREIFNLEPDYDIDAANSYYTVTQLPLENLLEDGLVEMSQAIFTAVQN